VEDARDVHLTKRKGSFNPSAVIGQELNLDVEEHLQNRTDA
jgi:hypothetical protein